METVKYCKSCGAYLPKGAEKCIACGEEIVSSAPLFDLDRRVVKVKFGGVMTEFVVYLEGGTYLPPENMGRTMAEKESQYTIDILTALAERTIKRLWILIILLVVLLFGTNAAWIYYEVQWEVVESTEITQENENGYNNYIGNDGDIYNGETNDP